MTATRTITRKARAVFLRMGTYRNSLKMPQVVYSALGLRSSADACQAKAMFCRGGASRRRPRFSNRLVWSRLRAQPQVRICFGGKAKTPSTMNVWREVWHGSAPKQLKNELALKPVTGFVRASLGWVPCPPIMSGEEGNRKLFSKGSEPYPG